MEKATTYIRTKQDLKRRIVKSEWLQGEKIPSSRDLAVYYKCSVNTIEKAVKELAAEGLLRREMRKGTVVADGDTAGRKEKSGLVGVSVFG